MPMDSIYLFDIRERLIKQAMSPQGLPNRDTHIMLVSFTLWKLLTAIYPDKIKSEFYGYYFFEVETFIRKNTQDINTGFLVQRLIQQVNSEHFQLVGFTFKLIPGELS